MKSILFSIITPVYNCEDYIEACIKSVLNQTYKNYEIILIDDGSTDKSGVICDKYATEFPFITVLHKSNEGAIKARNSGYIIAKGDYCLSLDSDDTLKTNALEILYEVIEKDSVDCVVFGLERIRNNRVIQTWGEKKNKKEVLFSKTDISRRVLSNPRYNSLGRKCIRSIYTKKMAMLRSEDVRHGEDLLCTIQLIKECGSFAFIPDILYEYRVNENSVTSKVDYEKYIFDYSSLGTFVMSFLKEDIKSPSSDINQYFIRCVDVLLSIVYGISTDIGMSQQMRLLLLKKLYICTFCKEYILPCNKIYKGKKRIFLNMFLNENYRLLVFSQRIIKKLNCLLARE